MRSVSHNEHFEDIIDSSRRRLCTSARVQVERTEIIYDSVAHRQTDSSFAFDKYSFEFAIRRVQVSGAPMCKCKET